KGKNAKRKSKQAIEWTDVQEKAFRRALDLAASAALQVPLDSDELEVHTDASDPGLGGALFVRRDDTSFQVQFVSKKLSGAQLNWSTRDKEAYAIIYCIEKFSHFVKSRRFVLKTDHQSLKSMVTARTGKLQRWAMLLAEYSIDVQWVKGEENY